MTFKFGRASPVFAHENGSIDTKGFWILVPIVLTPIAIVAYYMAQSIYQSPLAH
jgi:hypothetical protein